MGSDRRPRPGFALTPLGAARLAELQPQSDPHRVGQLLAATTEGVKYLDANPPFSLHAPEDLESIVASLAVEGRALEPLRLLAFAEFLDSVGLTCANDSARQRPVSHAEGHGGKLRIVQEPDCRSAPADRSVRRGERFGEPRADAPAHAASQSSARGCAPRSSRTCAARKRRAICRIRS